MDDAQKKRHQLQTCCSMLRKEFRRYDLTLRQSIIANVILDLSLCWGRRSVRIPKLEIFTDLTGISPGNVLQNLQMLHAMRIVEVDTLGGVTQYTLNLESDKWQCRPRVMADRVKAALDIVRALNDVAPEEGADGTEVKGTALNFPSAGDDHFLAIEIPDLGISLPKRAVPDFPKLSWIMSATTMQSVCEGLYWAAAVCGLVVVALLVLSWLCKRNCHSMWGRRRCGQC
jgi:hypothetical protein